VLAPPGNERLQARAVGPSLRKKKEERILIRTGAYQRKTVNLVVQGLPVWIAYRLPKRQRDVQKRQEEEEQEFKALLLKLQRRVEQAVGPEGDRGVKGPNQKQRRTKAIRKTDNQLITIHYYSVMLSLI
jgi:hypothetical protein